MVKETRLLVGVEDIVGVAMQCPHCDGESLYRLDGKAQVKPACQYCGAMVHGPTGEREGASVILLRVLRRLLKEDPGLVTARLALRYDERPGGTP